MSKRRPLVILRKVSSLLKRSIYTAKLSAKPIIPRLILLKRSRKMNPKSYHYRLLWEYEFSPTSTPLMFSRSRELSRRRFRDICDPLLYLCGCIGKVTTSAALDRDYGALALPPAAGDDFAEDADFELAQGGEDSVDQRAERFIEKFYEEMRMQRRQSI